MQPLTASSPRMALVMRRGDGCLQLTAGGCGMLLVLAEFACEVQERTCLAATGAVLFR